MADEIDQMFESVGRPPSGGGGGGRDSSRRAPGPRSAQTNQDIGNALLTFLSGAVPDYATELPDAPQDRPDDHTLMDALFGYGSGEALQSWMEPADATSRLAGSLIAGQRPTGNASVDPLIADALIERGVNPLLAQGLDLAFAPDPTGARKATDMVPLMGIIGTGILRMLRENPGLEFIRGSDAVAAPGNLLRRSPAEQSGLRQGMARTPEGIQEPAVIAYDPDRGVYYMGEGNHRAFAAMEEDSPLPVIVEQRAIPEGRGAPLPEAGQERIRAAMEAGEPLPMRASDLGIPAYGAADVSDFATMRALRNEMGVSADELEAALGPYRLDEIDRALQEMAVSPNPESRIRRSARVSPNYDETFTAAMMDFDPSVENFDQALAAAENLITSRGDRGLEFLHDITGLDAQELSLALRNVGMDAGEALPGPAGRGRLGVDDVRGGDFPDDPVTGRASPLSELDPEVASEVVDELNEAYRASRSLRTDRRGVARELPQGVTPDDLEPRIGRFLPSDTDPQMAGRRMEFSQNVSGYPEAARYLRDEIAPTAGPEVSDKVQVLLDRSTSALEFGDLPPDQVISGFARTARRMLQEARVPDEEIEKFVSLTLEMLIDSSL